MQKEMASEISEAIHLFCFVVQNFFCDEDRAVLGLFKGSAYIFADDTDTEQLDAAQKQDQDNDGCITGNVDTPEQFLDNDPDQVQNRDHRGDTANVNGVAQGLSREANDAFNGVVQQLAEAPFGGAGGPLAGGIGDEAGIVTHPGENALGEPVILTQLQNAVSHTPAEGAEIAGIRTEGNIGKMIDQRVEALLEEGEDLALATAVLEGGNHIVFRLVIQNLDHVPDNLRPLLEVGINQTEIVTGCVLQTGVQAGFLAEVPGEGHHLDRTGLDLVEFS